jgi:hypothetical protein
MTDTQAESAAMLTTLDAANRALRAAWGARTPCRAKGWQFQAGMYVMPGYGPSAEWGSWAFVKSYTPHEGECTAVKVWSPTWREAIECALGAALTL